MSTTCTRVLVVDDDVDACHNLADILEDVGYHVDVAHDGEAALTLLRKNPYDIALLDLKMPGMDGITLYREIRKISAGTVAMIVTAYATSDTADTALAAGAWHVLPKPVDFSRLLPLIEEASGQPLVMVVDDDHDLCDNVWSLLRERGFRVGLAHNPQQAAEQLKDGNYKVVLIDMRLPGADGREVYRIVREHARDARTLVITGYRSETSETVQQLIDEGADAVCYKPFDVRMLLQTVSRLAQNE